MKSNTYTKSYILDYNLDEQLITINNRIQEKLNKDIKDKCNSILYDYFKEHYTFSTDDELMTFVRERCKIHFENDIQTIYVDGYPIVQFIGNLDLVKNFEFTITVNFFEPKKINSDKITEPKIIKKKNMKIK